LSILTTRCQLPDEWAGKEAQWEDKLQAALEKADHRRDARRCQKEIDGRAYYYLQWREDDQIQTQYIAPVEP